MKERESIASWNFEDFSLIFVAIFVLSHLIAKWQ